MRVGSELKAARKKAGISVDVISKRTKVKVSSLVALEKGDFKKLPTGLYLFSMVRAYAREVHIDPEPMVEKLRTEFADRDALEALHALEATGALDAQRSAHVTRSREERSHRFTRAAIAAGVVLMATASAGVYLHGTGRTVHDVRSTVVTPSSPTPTVHSPNETAPEPLFSAASANMVATVVDVPQEAAAADQTPAPTTNHNARRRTAAVKYARRTAATTGRVPSDASSSSDVMPQIELPGPARTEEPADSPANVDNLKLEAPALAPAP